MSVGEPPRSPGDGAPRGLLPPDSDLGSDLDLVGQIWYGESRQANNYAIRAQGIAALARRRRREIDAVFGRTAGPGRDAVTWQHRALDEVSEAFVPELAQTLACTESEAEAAAVEAVLLTTK